MQVENRLLRTLVVEEVEYQEVLVEAEVVLVVPVSFSSHILPK